MIGPSHAFQPQPMTVNSPSPLQDDRFLVLGSLGHGGMASVYRAYDRIEQRVVALKVGIDDQQAGPAHPLSAEFEAWTRLRHPNIVEAYELVTASRGPLPNGTPYLVLEHVDGLPAHESLRPGRESPDALEELSVQLLRGLEHVHGAGLVHRDVKPANLLVRRQGRMMRLKLTDFGLATNAGSADEPGQISGSLPYVAPESILGRPLDGRADLYALGILLFQLATGRLPVPGERIEDLLRWHLGGPPADPRRHCPRFPPRLARFIRRLTARDPRERPGSASDALAMLGAPAPAADPLVNPISAPVEPALRVRLRLALDAARLGARRSFKLDAGHRDDGRLVGQLRAWTQMFGLVFYDLDQTRVPEETALVRLVMRLLIDRGDEAAATIDRFGLDRSLPLACLEGVPVSGRPRPDLPDRAGAARRIADFLLDSSHQRGLVLLVDPPRIRCALTRSVVALLRRRLRRPWPAKPGRGGLLLLTA
jgi:eukaryotic-like serine/threonine-protein kinase